MGSLLIGLHAFLGEFGIVAFIWLFIEMLSPTPSRIKRAKIAAVVGLILFFSSWIIGGYYYVEFYGGAVKPLIKAGSQPWAHDIFMETKEHLFLFLPILSLFACSLMFNLKSSSKTNKNEKKAILLISGLIIIIGGLIGLMGFLISSGFRSALEAII